MAGLLTDSLSDSFPASNSQPVVKVFIKKVMELHSSGTVRDLHPIPF